MSNSDDPPEKHSSKRKFRDHQYPPGVSGNPSGSSRSRKAQDRAVAATSGHDQAALDAFRRLVTQRDGSKVPTIAQIFTALTIESLERSPDQKKARRNSFNVSAMKLALAESRLSSAIEAKALYEVFERKGELQQDFERRRRKNRRPEDVVPHPEHVVPDPSGGISVNGPLTREQQEAWELIKFNIRLLAKAHESARRTLGANPEDPNAQAALAGVEKQRRAWMRKVPKGWNWREQIITCDSDAASLLDIADRLTNAGLSPETKTMIIQHYYKHALVRSFKPG